MEEEDSIANVEGEGNGASEDSLRGPSSNSDKDYGGFFHYL
jgi:hypothetical protein